MDYYSKIFVSWFLAISSMVAFLEMSAEAAAGVSLLCMEKLLPCQPYLHSSSPPPSSCCTPLQRMVDDGGECLCQVFNNPASLKSFSLTQDDALKLPKACGFDADISVCKNETTTPPTSSSAPPPISTPSNSSSDSSEDSNAANGITYFEGNGFIGLLVALLMFVSAF